MVMINDLEWPMLLYYVIYYENLIKVMHQTENVALRACIENAVVSIADLHLTQCAVGQVE